MESAPPPHVGFVLEQTLGHVTHADNLRSIISADRMIRATWCPIAFGVDGVAARLPGYRSNWTVRAGVRARRSVRRAHRDDRLDALFVHTQVPAVLLGRWMRRIPTVVSLDATPLQYDELGDAYSHGVGPPRVEQAKHALNVRCFRAARQLVTWSSWAKVGLVDGYGVDPQRVRVIPPGVWCDRWVTPPPGAPTRGTDDVVRILFVGADLARKGGDVLLTAFELLRADHGPGVELHLVTKSEVPPAPGVYRYGDLDPNSDELKALYHRCDIFCLPTRADCLPMVLSEAGAAGLPLVSTAVAAIPEIVSDGRTGLVVPPGDVAALARALSTLVTDPQRRTRLGDAARALVLEHYDASKNASSIVALMIDIAGARR
jgi:glycosyltransferase involved in cell wall biosynthesis